MHRFFVMRDERHPSTDRGREAEASRGAIARLAQDAIADSGSNDHAGSHGANHTGSDATDDAIQDADPDTPWPVGAELKLLESDATHIARVLRLKPGQSIIVCDGHAFDYEARLVHVSPRSVRVRITSVEPSFAEPRLSLTLVQGIAKGSKMDLIVQKAVEVGVTRIIPVLTERTVVQLDGKKSDSRVERWQRIAYEAAKQAGRGRVPIVQSIHSWADLWQRDDLGFVLVPWESEDRRGLLEAVRTWEQGSAGNDGAARVAGHEDAGLNLARGSSSASPAITIVIGPEGGLTVDEIALAERHGAHPVTMGPRILRTETAAIVASALVLGAFGEMG